MMCRVRSLLCRGAEALVLVALIASLAEPVAGQGIIMGLERQPTNLILERQTVDALLDDNVAVVTVEHEFHNPSNVIAEGIFLFPLPTEAQVTRFAMDVDGRELIAELLSADDARQIYEDIVRRSLDPALLELVELRTFQARIFPIPPGERRTIRLRYDAILPRDGHTVTFNYPLRSMITSRPFGRPLASNAPTPDVDRSAGALTLRINGSSPLTNIYSPSHQISAERPNARHAVITHDLEHSSGRDFILYFGLSASEVGASLLTHRPYEDRPGYFMMLLSPRMSKSDRSVQPKDIVFVLDTSGSMAGEKIRQAKEALRYCLNRLGERDRFGVIAFSSDIDVMRDELQPASARENALYFVDQLEATGGTNINEALLAAARLLRTSERGMIVFLTDGLPSVGITDEPTIRKNLDSTLRGDARVFAFGVGYDVNTRLLDGLARESKAFAEYISPDESIETRVSTFYEKIRYPFLTDLTFQMEGADVYAFAPRELGDLYHGGQLIVAGRYRSPGRGTLTIRGRRDEAAEVFEYPLEFPRVERERDFVARLWATRRVGQLLDEIRNQGERGPLKDEVVALAKEFGLVTPYTSYLVQEEDLLTQDRQRPGRFSLDARMFAPAAMESSSGAEAVGMSKAIREMEEATVTARLPGSRAQVVEGRLMILGADSVWMDAELTGSDAPVLSVKFASDAYFQLLRQYPEAGAFARIGRAVTFRLRGKVVAVAADGRTDVTERELQSMFG